MTKGEYILSVSVPQVSLPVIESLLLGGPEVLQCCSLLLEFIEEVIRMLDVLLKFLGDLSKLPLLDLLGCLLHH